MASGRSSSPRRAEVGVDIEEGCGVGGNGQRSILLPSSPPLLMLLHAQHTRLAEADRSQNLLERVEIDIAPAEYDGDGALLSTQWILQVSSDSHASSSLHQ